MSLHEHILTQNYSTVVGVGDGSGGGTLEPLAVADFENDEYSIGGVSKTYAQMYSMPAGLLELLVGEGLDMGPAGATASASETQSVVATAALISALAPDCTAVFDFDLVDANMTTDGAVTMWSNWTGSQDEVATYIRLEVAGDETNAAIEHYVDNVRTLGPTGLVQSDAELNGSYRVAVNLSQSGRGAISYNGSAVLGGDPSAPLDDTNTHKIWFYTWRSTTMHLRLRKVTYYALQDEADLPTLSALDEPIAVSNFRTGDYSINGVSKTFADMWELSFITGGFEGVAPSVLADVGLSMDDPAGTSCSATMVATPELLAAVPELSFTAVFDVRVTATGIGADSLVEFQFGVQKDDFSSMSIAQGNFGGADISPTEEGIGLKKRISGATTFQFADGNETLYGTRRVAVTITPDEASISINGGAVSTDSSPGVNFALLQQLFLFWLFNGTTGGGNITFEKVEIYSPQSAARLPQLSGPVPLAVSDFAAGAYSISGVSKTVAQTWEADGANWYGWNPAVHITPGIGITPPDAAQYYPGPVAHADLFAILDRVNGFTFVMDIEMSRSIDMVPAIYCSLVEFPGYDAGIDFGVTHLDGVYIASYPPTVFESTPWVNGRARIAFTLAPDACAFSVDGGPVIPFTDAPLSTFTDATDFALACGYDGNPPSGTGTQSVSIKRITFLPLQDEADLPALSA